MVDINPYKYSEMKCDTDCTTVHVYTQNEVYIARIIPDRPPNYILLFSEHSILIHTLEVHWCTHHAYVYKQLQSVHMICFN